MKDWGSMDSNDLKKLWRGLPIAKKFDTSIGSSSSQPKGPLLREQAMRKCTIELPNPSFAKGRRMAKDMVQSLLLPTDIPRMHEANPKAYRYGADHQ